MENAKIFFYRTIDEFGEFSNFSRHHIYMDGLRWPTVEHYFQAQKFLDEEYPEKIRLANTPKIASDLGRSRKVKLREDWEEVKDEFMYLGVKAKFTIHPKLRDLLISTKDAEICEDAKSDSYWGIGFDGLGLNKLGKTLERVRSEIASGNY